MNKKHGIFFFQLYVDRLSFSMSDSNVVRKHLNVVNALCFEIVISMEMLEIACV